MKKFLLFFLLSVLFFAVVHRTAAQSSNTTSPYRLLNVRLLAHEEKIVPAPFIFQAISLSEADPVEVRFLQQGKWTDWRHFESQQDEEGYAGSELNFIAPSTSFALRADHALTVQVTVMDVQDVPYQLAENDQLALDVGTSSGDGSQLAEAPRIITRQEWGADESLGVYHPEANPDTGVVTGDAEAPTAVNICKPLEQAYPGQFVVQDREVKDDPEGEPLVWPRQYSSKIKKIVIHHTAEGVRDFNNDGRIDSSDYRAALRSIYVFHTVSRHWGDIGYQYIVDPDGNIYEGRAGGQYVIAANVLCQNSNTVGVALMGNFEEQAVPDKEFVGAVKIVKYLSDLYQVNPMGKSSFRGTVLPNIVTHSEIGAVTKTFIGTGATQCPGKNMVALMPHLREIVEQGGIRPDYAFNVVSLPQNVTLDPLQDYQAVVRIKNAGTVTWTQVQLQGQGREDGFISKDMISIGADQELEIPIPLSAQLQGGTKTLSFVVQLNAAKQRKKISFTYHINAPVYRYELTGFSGAQGPVLVGEKRTLTLQLKNTSNFPWLIDGKEKFQLRPVSRHDDNVDFVTNVPSLTLKEKVAVGGSVTLGYDLPLQRQIGALQLEYMPTVAGNRGLKGKAILLDTTVEAPKFVADILPVERRATIEKGFTKTIAFQLFNHSNFDWEKGMVWYQLGRGDRVTISQALKRGESIPFQVSVQAGYDDHEVVVRGVLGIDHLPQNISLPTFRKSQLPFNESVRTVGAVRLTADLVGQTNALLPNAAGVYQASVQLKNTGTVPWYREGKDRIVLTVRGTADFADASWERRKIAGILDKALVMPGEVGTFAMTLDVKSVLRRTTTDEFQATVGDRSVRVGSPIQFGVEVKGSRSRTENPNVQDSNDQTSSLPTGKAGNDQNSNVQNIPSMRVWLSEFDQSTAQVSSSGAFVFWDSKSVQIREHNAGDTVTIAAKDLQDGVIIRVKATGAGVLLLKNWQRGGTNSSDNQFRNVLEFQMVDGKLTVINELVLEDYLKGVAEEPESDDIPQEKRKVMAVLARSYALHYLISGYEKFPGQPYNSADSPAIFQKYLGYGFEQRAPKWQSALEATSGEVVMVTMTNDQPRTAGPMSNNERILRTAYFSCTDGPKTKTPAEAGWKDSYFTKFSAVFQSVADPLGHDPTRSGLQACGHQVGLSGYGATQMAKAGKSYQEIIQYYYQGVQVVKFQD